MKKITKDLSKDLCDVILIGVGSMSETIHIPILRSFRNVKIKAIVDPYTDEQKMEKISDLLSCEWFRDIDGLKADLGVIVTPISTHFNIGLTLAELGVNLLVEKPFTVKYSEAKTLINSADKNACRIYCGQMRRFFKNVNVAKLIISNGLIGTLRKVTIQQGGLYSWKRAFFEKEKGINKIIDEGVLYDVGCHPIDSLIYILDEFSPSISIVNCISDDIDIQSNVQIIGKITINSSSKSISLNAKFSNTVSMASYIAFEGTLGKLMLLPDSAKMPYLITKSRDTIIFDNKSILEVDPFLKLYETIFDSLGTKKKTIIDAKNILKTVKTLDDSQTKMQAGYCDWVN